MEDTKAKLHVVEGGKDSSNEKKINLKDFISDEKMEEVGPIMSILNHAKAASLIKEQK